MREGGGRGDVREGGGGGDGGCELREVVMVGGGEEVLGEDGESVSVTVTEISDEGEDDTMFEETLPQHTLGTYICIQVNEKSFDLKRGNIGMV